MSNLLDIFRAIRSKSPKKRISFVYGNFNVIHSGHIRLLRFAREMADILVVGVFMRNEYNAAVAECDRLENVCALSIVDHAYLLNLSLPETLRALQPNFVVKGKEHETTENIEIKIMEEFGGKLVFSSGFSSGSEADTQNLFTTRVRLPLHCPQSFMQRHGIVARDLEQLLHSMQNIRATVIGDTIVDEYVHCDPLGMSQEDPTIVVQPYNTQRYLGGAGIVAAHAAGLGAQVNFVTVCGQDTTSSYVKDKLAEYCVKDVMFYDTTRPTTLKQRYRCRGKTLLRVSHLRQHDVDKGLVQDMLCKILPLLNDTDVVFFSDFNYGCLPQSLVDEVLLYARKRQICIVADSQSSSQVGDVSRFTGATLLTPTERESRLAVHDFASGLVVLANRLLEKTAASNIIMTLGEAGILVQPGIGSNTDQLPALNKTAKDVAGAGDSLLVCTGLALAAGGNIWQAACLGSLAAAIQVSREGNIPLHYSNVIDCLKEW